MNEIHELMSLSPPDRDRIHELSIKCRQTGLSPPESEELAFLEGKETLNVFSDDSDDAVISNALLTF